MLEASLVAQWERIHLPIQDRQEIPVRSWVGKSPGGGNGNSLWSSCLEHPMDGVSQQATAHGLQESDMTERLCMHISHAGLCLFFLKFD